MVFMRHHAVNLKTIQTFNQNRESKNTMNTIKKNIKDEINNLFWLSLLQGISFIVLGVWIYFQPVVLLALVVVEFLIFGTLLVITAIRIKKFGKELDEALDFSEKK